MMEFKEKNPTIKEYEIQDTKSFYYYTGNMKMVSDYFKQKSGYQRLCLNNPSQSLAAHQSKKAMVLLFEDIKKRGYLRKIRIANFIYDEIVLEVEENLAEEAREMLQNAMLTAANSYLDTEFVRQTATANIANDWYHTK